MNIINTQNSLNFQNQLKLALDEITAEKEQEKKAELEKREKEYEAAVAQAQTLGDMPIIWIKERNIFKSNNESIGRVKGIERILGVYCVCNSYKLELLEALKQKNKRIASLTRMAQAPKKP